MVKKTSSKPKKRRTFAADKHNTKTRTDVVNKSNPFDLHVNRLKHDVLGKRRNYEKGGQPLKSRSRGIEKRKRTLLKELNSVFKKNTFIDYRLGENDPTLTNDEKLMQRLIAERSKTRLGKESRYNLNDEEDLTHYGQSLSKSDELNQKPVVDDYDDDDLNKGRLKSDSFFGGFQNPNDQRKPQSKKEWIEDMIKSTKLDKYERQRENEKVFDLTSNLDEQWKALSKLINVKERQSKDVKETSDDYDKLVNSLKFEAKTTGVPVKTIEEREKEAAERLKTLQIAESERMERPTLKSILAKNRPQTHLSVEELDESYYILDGTKRRVTFDDENEADKNGTLPTEETTTDNGDDSTPVDNEEQGDNDDNEEEEEETEETTNGDLAAEFEEIPSSLDILENRIREDKNTINIIWKRIRDKRLPPIPKIVLSNYFDVLLDYYVSIKPNQVIYNKVSKILLDLLQSINNDQTKANILNRLKQYHVTLSEQIEEEKFCQVDLSFIVFLKLITYLYPTSDFRHPITTPALTLLIQAVHHASLNSLSSCRQALLLIELTKQWISKTTRYVPEVIVLLMKLLQLACPTEKSKHVLSCSSKQSGNNQLLVINKNIDLSKSTKLNVFSDNDLDDDDNDEHRAMILQTCLNSLIDFLNIYQSLSAIVEIAQPFKSLLQTIAETSKCNQISLKSREVLTLIDTIQTTCLTNRKHLEQGKEQTKILRLYEPRFGPVYEGKKNTRLPKEHAERMGLRRKYKRELKSTTRALILDNQFIAREELRQQMEKDTQRKRKVKDILSELSMQEGEYRKLQKTK
ncbi:unnamed protein product [Adineta steineri]|uniref:Nucleolar protein 14 n=1 Tax=Adineta steineri TaxID=433720 RepID=A0A819SFT7_9BILA|nr:unnamed protein product [Adineta steineri]